MSRQHNEDEYARLPQSIVSSAQDETALREFLEPEDRLGQEEGNGQVADLVALARASLRRGRLPDAKQAVSRLFSLGYQLPAVRQALVPVVHESIGRAHAANRQYQAALRAFRAALAAGRRGHDSGLLPVAMLTWHLMTMGLDPMSWLMAEGGGQKPRPSFTSPLIPRGESTSAMLKLSRRSQRAYDAYVALSERVTRQSAPPFLYLNSKSLPRSGLHYLRDTLADLLGPSFSFCERYHEPGCCGHAFCTLTGYAEESEIEGHAAVRLVKSHDLALDDPEIPPTNTIQTLVLIRDPLFVLSSWFSFDELRRHAPLLKRFGITVEKISYLHERPLVRQAFRVLDTAYEPEGRSYLAEWLRLKVGYIKAFSSKWLRPPYPGDAGLGHLIVRYEQLPSFVTSLCTRLYDWLPSGSQARIQEYVLRGTLGFRPRSDPFDSRSNSLADHMRAHAGMFYEAAEELRNHDTSGSLSAASAV